MTNKTKTIICLGAMITTLAVGATVGVLLSKHDKKHQEQPQPIKHVINLPIPVERVRQDLNGKFPPQRINLIIEQYQKGTFDIYKFYDELEKGAQDDTKN